MLGEVVAKLHYVVVLFQHFSYLHLYGGTQLLPLKHTKACGGQDLIISFIISLLFIAEKTKTMVLLFHYLKLSAGLLRLIQAVVCVAWHFLQLHAAWDKPSTTLGCVKPLYLKECEDSVISSL